jgi:hypothetical protein
MRDLMRQQGAYMKLPEDQQDGMTLVELQEKFDQVVAEELNPLYIEWGVQKISGLAIRGQELEVKDWAEWPSALFEEILAATKSEAELNGGQRKNLQSRTDTGGPVPETPKPTSAEIAENEDSGKTATAFSTTPIM